MQKNSYCLIQKASVKTARRTNEYKAGICERCKDINEKIKIIQYAIKDVFEQNIALRGKVVELELIINTYEKKCENDNERAYFM